MKQGARWDVPILGTPVPNPAANRAFVYVKADGGIYVKTSDGAEHVSMVLPPGGVTGQVLVKDPTAPTLLRWADMSAPPPSGGPDAYGAGAFGSGPFGG